MPYSMFQTRFPELAQAETRSISTRNSPDLPDDDYGLIEMYCDEPGCDCRRVMFAVASHRRQEMVAYIAYGWESRRFYMDWFGQDNPDPDVIDELKGPALNLMSPQSELASTLLGFVAEVLQDKQYVNRLKRHYRMFRKTVEPEAAPQRRSRKPKRKRRKRR